MSAKIIVPVYWTGDENGEYDTEMIIDSFIEQLEELTGDTIRLTIESQKTDCRGSIKYAR